jgi:hypothetical protein
MNALRALAVVAVLGYHVIASGLTQPRRAERRRFGLRLRLLR